MRPIYAREITEEERQVFAEGLRSASAFKVRRSQIILKSADNKLKAREIARHLCCSDQAVREGIDAFEREGVACLEEGSHAPKNPETAFDEEGAKWLKEIIHQSPRDYGVNRSLWSLHELSQVAYEAGITSSIAAPATISRTLERVGVNWQRAKQWITSPDENYDVKKNDGIG